MTETTNGLNTLKNFSQESIDRLIEKGVIMRHLELDEDLGLWIPCSIVAIQKNLSMRSENRTIVHEWLHAYEDIILYPHPNFEITIASRSPETIIEAYARWHHQQNPDLVRYIREQFREHGF